MIPEAKSSQFQRLGQHLLPRHGAWTRLIPQVLEKHIKPGLPNQLLSLKDQRPLFPHKTSLGKDHHPWVKAFRPIDLVRGYKQTTQALQSPELSMITNSPILLLLQTQGSPKLGWKLNLSPVPRAASKGRAWGWLASGRGEGGGCCSCQDAGDKWPTSS